MIDIAIIGGGAAGYFTALRCAELLARDNKRVVIFESHKLCLRKVKISGGGRCNVTHHQFDIAKLCEHYPRGKKELRSPFHQFQPADTVKWFEKRGLKLKVEADGRMFPEENTSQAVIDCFEKEARYLNVEVVRQKRVVHIEKQSDYFLIKDHEGKSYQARYIHLATGSDPRGHELARQLGHSITELAPSLFTFKIKNPLLSGLAGTSFASINLKMNFPKKKYDFRGPALITHWGLSGPVTLKMSSWCARELKAANYNHKLFVNWTPYEKEVQVTEVIEKLKREHSNSLIKNQKPIFLSKNFWVNFLSVLSINQEKKWSELAKKEQARLIQELFRSSLMLGGQSRFKEEFVECGGVSSKEVNFKTMESKVVTGLFFAGEILDIDGVTGGFNFQNAWTTGFIAGTNMARKLTESD